MNKVEYKDYNKNKIQLNIKYSETRIKNTKHITIQLKV